MSRSSAFLLLLLCLTFVRGVLYASIVPPWQAPDEPAHFERVRAALNTDEWQGDIEPTWYPELVTSMFSFRFWNYAAPSINLPPDLPLNQYINLYHEVYDGQYSSRITYLVMGLPLWFVPTDDLVHQLYAVRLYTVLFNVVVIWLSYRLVRQIFPTQPTPPQPIQ